MRDRISEDDLSELRSFFVRLVLIMALSLLCSSVSFQAGAPMGAATRSAVSMQLAPAVGESTNVGFVPGAPVSQTGQLVDNGRGIPTDQILVGPRQAQLQLDEDSKVRGVGAMLHADRARAKALTSGHKAGTRVGYRAFHAVSSS